MEKVKEAIRLKVRSEVLNELVRESHLSQEVANEKIQQDYAQFSKKHEWDISNLESIELDSLLQQSVRTKRWSRLFSLFSIVYLIWFIANVMVILAIGLLFKEYIIPYMQNMSMNVIEFLTWAACFCAVIAGNIYNRFVGRNTTAGVLIALTGCLGMIGAYSFTVKLHSHNSHDAELAFEIFCALMTLIWSPIAIWFESRLIGLGSILVLEGFIATRVKSFPFLLSFLGSPEDPLARVIAASASLLLIYIASKITTRQWPYFKPFELGCLYVASAFYWISAVIISSRHYQRSYGNFDFLLIRNLISIGFALAILLLCSTTRRLRDLSLVTSFCLVFFLAEKYLEIPWNVHFAWILLGLGLFLYFSALILNALYFNKKTHLE